jgi:uncharacterized iron-regulated protein
VSLNDYLTQRLTAMYDDPMTSYEQHEAEQMERLDEWAEDQHQTELELHAKELWKKTKHYRITEVLAERTIPHRLEILARNMHAVSRRGAGEGHESEYQMDLLLTEWGPGKLIAYFGALAETEGQ